MRAVTLAGGLGPRLAEETERRPKPMVGIEGRPILWHIMSHDAAHGVSAAQARDRLGWEPRFTLEEGQSRTVPWYCNFLGARKAA